MRTGRLAGLVLLVLAATLASAAEPPVTLAEVIDRAVERAPGGLLEVARSKEADSLDRQARSWLAGDPSLDVQYVDDSLGTDLGFREWEAALDLPLPMPGQRSARRRVSEAAALQAVEYPRQRRWQIAGEVREALWAVQRGRTAVRQAEQALAASRELERNVARRVEAGELSRADEVLARQETAQRETALEDARQELAPGLATYRRLTGTEQLPARPAEALSERDEAAPDHPQLALLQADLERARAAQQRDRIERRDNWSLRVVGRRDRAASGADFGNSVGLAINIPFGTASQTRPVLAEAERVAAEAELAFERAQRELSIAMEASRARLDSLERARASATRADELAQDYLAIQERAFELGETDLTELLRARDRAIDARGRLEQRSTEYLREIARFNQIAGELPE